MSNFLKKSCIKTMEFKPLKELAQINPDSIKKDYPHDEIEYIDIQSVGSGYLIETKLMPLSKAPSRAKRLIKDGDTILSTVRPNRRSFLYIKKPKNNVVVSTGFAVLRAKDGIDSRYLYYAVTDQKFTDYLTLSAKGAAYPAVDTEIIAMGKIPIWPINLQKKISSILSAYDDLIQNNTRRIQILEEMAQLIYREWFVNFRFPGHEKVKFVDSELGKIPEGWKVTPLFDLVEVKYGKNLPTKKLIEGGAYPVYGAAKIIGWYHEYTRMVPTIICGCRGSVGEMQITKPQCFVTNNSFTFDPSHPDNFFWLFLALKHRGLKDVVGGAAQPQITLESISSIRLITPPIFLRSQFQKLVTSIFELVWSLDGKNANLRRTRDLLLPKLISGELDISDLDIVIREQAP